LCVAEFFAIAEIAVVAERIVFYVNTAGRLFAGIVGATDVVVAVSWGAAADTAAAEVDDGAHEIIIASIIVVHVATNSGVADGIGAHVSVVTAIGRLETLNTLIGVFVAEVIGCGGASIAAADAAAAQTMVVDGAEQAVVTRIRMDKIEALAARANIIGTSVVVVAVRIAQALNARIGVVIAQEVRRSGAGIARPNAVPVVA
jgi:hypothetical protein